MRTLWFREPDLLTINPGWGLGGKGGDLVTGYATNMNESQTVQFLTGAATTGNVTAQFGVTGGATFGGAHAPTVFEHGGGLGVGVSVTTGYSGTFYVPGQGLKWPWK
jgi:hypothetical protein